MTTKSTTADLISQLRELSAAKYCEALRIARTAECLGWEAKVKSVKFGPAEMDAHTNHNLAMGEHIGIAKAIKLITTAQGRSYQSLTGAAVSVDTHGAAPDGASNRGE